MRAPSGILGVQWGDDAAQSAKHIGLDCQEWQAWEGGEGFEVCSNVGHPIELYGGQAYVRLVRHGTRLEGVDLSFPNRSWKELRAAAAPDLHLGSGESESDAPYVCWSSGVLVHVASNGPGGGHSITVAGPRFGEAYKRYLLKQGMGGLGHSLQPH